MSQHSFSDVLTNIANVASSAKNTAITTANGTTSISGVAIANGTITGSSIQNGSITIDKISDLQQAV